MLGIIGAEICDERAGVERRDEGWRDLNPTVGNNGKNLREISKHQEPGITISVKLSISRSFIILREGEEQHRSQIIQQSWRQFLIASAPGLTQTLGVDNVLSRLGGDVLTELGSVTGQQLEENIQNFIRAWQDSREDRSNQS